MVSILLTALGISGLFLFGRKLDDENEVKRQFKYQSTTLLLSLALLLVSRFFSDRSLQLNSDLSGEVSGLSWLGIANGSKWSAAASTFLAIPFLVTSLVVYFQVLKGKKVTGLLSAVLIAIPFSISNSFTEEVIFRVIGVEGLTYSTITVAVICGIWFGIPHYFGTPGKVPGVLMAGFLGYVMALTMLQTGGIALAWAIHFVQDVPIIAMLILNSRAKSA